MSAHLAAAERQKPRPPPSAIHQQAARPRTAGGASAQLSSAADLLLTLTSAIKTIRELRNATLTARAARDAAAPGPVSGEPFSVRVLRVDATGGPLYEWKAATVASDDALTIAASGTTNVRRWARCGERGGAAGGGLFGSHERRAPSRAVDAGIAQAGAAHGRMHLASASSGLAAPH